MLSLTKKISLIVNSSHHSEAAASAKGVEAITYARKVTRGMGVMEAGPTLLGTDNLANLRIGLGVGCPTRSKHFLRIYWLLKQAIAAGKVTLRHVPDAHMPADYLPKFVPRAKLELSVEYATNSHGRRGSA